MGVTVAEVADLARRGVLEWRDLGSRVVIRPAVVCVGRVRRRRGAADVAQA